MPGAGSKARRQKRNFCPDTGTCFSPEKPVASSSGGFFVARLMYFGAPLLHCGIMTVPFQDPAVAAAFDSFPAQAKPGLLELRDLIFEGAAATSRIGTLVETLKWGQPAYLTQAPKTGTTIRLGIPKTGGFALYVPCQTTLIADFGALFPGEFNLEGNRGVHFTDGENPPLPQLRLLIEQSLTYHLKT